MPAIGRAAGNVETGKGNAMCIRGKNPAKRLIKCIVITCAVLFCFVAVVAMTMIIPYDITEKIFADIGEMAFLAEFSAGDIEDEDIHGLEYAEAFQKSIEYEGHCYSVLGYAFNDISTARAYYTRASGERPFPELWFSCSLHSDIWKTDYICYFENNVLRVMDERFLASSVHYKDTVAFINWMGNSFSITLPEVDEVIWSTPVDDISNTEGSKGNDE